MNDDIKELIGFLRERSYEPEFERRYKALVKLANRMIGMDGQKGIDLSDVYACGKSNDPDHQHCMNCYRLPDFAVSLGYKNVMGDR